MQQERVRAVGMNSVDLKGKKKSTMEAVFGNKDSSKPSNLRLVQRINSHDWRRAWGVWCPWGGPAFITQKEWEGTHRGEVEELGRFGGCGTGNS